MLKLLFPIVALLFAGGMAGCQTDKHVMSKPEPGKVSVCTKCYEQVHRVREWYGRTGPIRDQVRITHRCDVCQTDMSVYTENGVLRVRCPTCAPAGVDCDMCTPKDAR